MMTRLYELEPYSLDRIVGTSPVMTVLKSRLARLAADPSSAVILAGERGTGKHLAAKVLHCTSPCAARPFIAVKCSQWPQDLLQNELVDPDSTIFLDEMRAIPVEVRPKFFRFLEGHPRVRIIAATSVDGGSDVRLNGFIEEFVEKLGAEKLELPPLRSRSEDLPALIEFFVGVFNQQFGKSVRGVSTAALQMLTEYSWPGNVTELRNAIERAIMLTGSSLLEPADFVAGPAGSKPFFFLPPDGVELENVERSLVQQALERTNWNQTRSAKLLGLNRDQIHYRIEKFQLRIPGRPAA